MVKLQLIWDSYQTRGRSVLIMDQFDCYTTDAYQISAHFVVAKLDIYYWRLNVFLLHEYKNTNDSLNNGRATDFSSLPANVS